MNPMILLVLAACSGGDAQGDGSPGDDPTAGAPVPFEPQPATLHRLTDDGYRAAVSDLVGVDYTGALPVDLVLHGYTSVGASELTIPPLDLELYEAASWVVADQAIPDAGARDALLGCDGTDPQCIRTWAAATGRRAWRRPPTIDELDAVQDLWEDAEATYGADLAAQGVLAAILQSPHFLFRVEIGEPHPDDPAVRRYSSWEMAGRLSAFLWNSVPDEALADAADDGVLTDDGPLLAEAERMLADPRAEAALTRFFAETLELQDLDQADKDADLFPEWGPDLREAAITELERLFQEVVFDDDADFGTLLTTNAAWIDGPLAQVYDVPMPADAPLTRTVLDTRQQRGGILGRVGLLALNAHATVNSPTHRGKFVRGRLLCQSIPPPPAGIDASLDEADTSGTLRDQLSQHADDPACSGCHDAMDPMGFAMEHFDPIGARRELDNGLPIDATGELDGAFFDGAAELGAAVAAHPEFPGCITLNLYRHATGQAERVPELVEIDALTDLFVEDGKRLKQLALAIIASDAFRTATAPLGETCDDEGATRACSTACGEGVELCTQGAWRGCDAPAVGSETCNGADDDCDGLVDERLEQVCGVAGDLGTEVCVDGGWTACSGPDPAPTAEVCNGLDDDNDGAVDEDLEVAVVSASYADLSATHPDCDAQVAPDSPGCRAAGSRWCAASDCAVTGSWPLALSANDAELFCLDASEGVPLATTYTELAAQHPSCDGVERIGPNCNAAIHRLCAGQGLVSGYGPTENAGDDATVVCTPGATVFDGSYAVLSGYAPTCDGNAQREGPACSGAIHLWCRDQGFLTGFGPVENSGDLAIVSCLGGN